MAQVIVSSGDEADVLDEERQLLGVVAVRVPGEAVVAAHAEPAAGLEDAAGALGAAFERLLVAVDDALRHAELRAALDAGLLEVQGRHHGRVALQQQVERLVVHEGAVLERVVAGPQGVLDALRWPGSGR